VTDIFGDFDVDDAWGIEPPDPEQVAYRLHLLRVEVDAYTNAIGLPTWDELTPDEQEIGLGVGAVVVDYLARHDPDPVDAARSLHNVRRYWASSRLPLWNDLSAEDRTVGIDLMTLILTWLRRQGALDAI
jgi:hypothetical protein